MKFLLLIFCFIYSELSIYANDYSFNDLLVEYLKLNDTTKTKNIIQFSYGPSNVYFSEGSDEKISLSYTSRLIYGFFRNRNYHDFDIVSQSSEFVYLNNTSSHFKPRFIKKGDLTIDGWGFGFGLNSGFGYYLFDNLILFLNHSVDVNWQRFDFEILSEKKTFQDLQKRFDEKFKFGYNYSSNLNFLMNERYKFGISYDQNLIFNRTNTKSIIKILLFDNFFQFWIEFLEPILVEKYKDNYPLIKWFYKNSISYFLWNVRSSREYFPFENDAIPLNSKSVMINFTFIFE